MTPDELGEAWDGGKTNLQLLSYYNDEPFGCPNAGVDMTFEFPQLVAHAAKTRPLAAGANCSVRARYQISKALNLVLQSKKVE